MRVSPLSMPLRGKLVALALLVFGPARAQTQDQSWKTHVDTLFGYAFSYPASYHIEQQSYRLYLTDGHLSTEVYVENWTKPVTRGEYRWDLASLAANRAEGSCMVGGPDCSMSCKVRNPEVIPNSQGVRVVAVSRRLFGACEERSIDIDIDPLYVADLSGGGAYYLLIFESRLNQHGVPVETVRSIVATIRRVGKQAR